MRLEKTLLSVLGGGILAFGLYHVHSISGVTEGGALGLTLLLNHWLKISPAWSGLFINFCCYAFGLRTLGKAFLFWSALSALTTICNLKPLITVKLRCCTSLNFSVMKSVLITLKRRLKIL